MRVYQRISAVSSLLFIIGVILSACGSAPSTGAPPAAPQAQSGPSAAPVELRILAFANTPVPPPEQDFVKQALDQALGANIALTTVVAEDDYYSQLNTRLASGSPPDLFFTNRALLAQYVAKGQALDLTPYLDQLQPAITFIGEDSLKKGQIDGQTYAIAKAPYAPQFTYWVRKDWLDTLGLQPPTTPEEFLNVATAFTENDPDGNGKKDTYGLTGPTFTTPPFATNAFAPIFGAFGVGTPGSFSVKDGKLVNAFDDPGMQEALAFIRKLSAAGVVDPELAANSGTQPRDKAIQGQFGIVYAGWPELTSKQPVEQIKTVNPNAEWIQIPPLKGPGGQSDGVLDIGATSGMYAVPPTLASQPEKLQKVFDLLNYVSDGEGALLVQFGRQGTHFNLEGDKVVPTELMSQAIENGGATYSWIYQFTGRPEVPYLKTKFGGQIDYINFAVTQPRMEVLNGFVIAPEGYNVSDTNRYMQEQLLNFTTGSRSLDEYDAFVQELNTTYNYQAFRDAAQQQLIQLGYVK